MSRGHGYLQRWLLENIARSDKAMTFNEILVAAYPESSMMDKMYWPIEGRDHDRFCPKCLGSVIRTGDMA